MAPAMKTAHTGAMVMMNGLSVSLAECESRSKAAKTSRLPYTSKTSPTPTPSALSTAIGCHWDG